MKKYLISSICFLAIVNFIVLSCTTNDSAPEANTIVLPQIATTPATIINQTAATCGGNLLSSGNGTILSRGICYSTLPDPTIADSRISKPGTLGTYTCAITGLTAATLYYVRAYASNSAGVAYGEQITFTTTTIAIALPVVTTAAATQITETGAMSGGEVTSVGGGALTGRGICWAITPDPTTSNNVVNDAALTLGTFTSALVDLSPGTTYYIRAFASNSGGVGYGLPIMFTTAGTPPAGLPTITTNDVTSITQTSATSGGNVTADGGSAITARGICWATTENPTVLNNIVPATGTTGPFTSALTGLTANTMYHVRAYATNSTGTNYGQQMMFTTTGGTTTGPTGGHAVCNGTQPTAVVPITSATGRIWMDRNLGASRAATSKTDFEAYGCLYQWGRGNDGHASMDWVSGTPGIGTNAGTAVNGTTLTLSSTDNPGNALFIINENGHYDWRNPRNDDLWQDVDGINNPCPAGYRIPTILELEDEFDEYSITGGNAAFNSIHKFVLAGGRAFDSANITGQGTNAVIYSSSVSLYQVYGVSIEPDGVYTDAEPNRAGGSTVRCIKN